MIAVMVIVLDEGGDLALEIAGQVVVFKQDAILERLMPALDLALGLWVIGGAADVLLCAPRPPVQSQTSGKPSPTPFAASPRTNAPTISPPHDTMLYEWKLL